MPLDLLAPAQSWQLPLPPSTNNLFANTPHGRRKTAEYRAWLREAGWELRAQLAHPVPGKTYALTIAAPINRRRDLDNIAKPVCDLLVELCLVPDDRWIDSIHLSRLSEGDKMWVSLRALS